MLSMIYRFIARLGAPFAKFIMHLGGVSMLLVEILLNAIIVISKPHLLLKEIYYSGVRSIVIVIISGWFVGMVLGLQGYHTLAQFGSVSVLGTMIALSIIRELGPVLTAIFFASRAGSGMTAEIGLMKATEQLDAMNIMGVNPVKRVIAPKFFGGIIAVPILGLLFSVAGIIGGYFISVPLLKVDAGMFWSQMQSSVNFDADIVSGIIKTTVFGVIVTMISLYQGVIAKPTAAGVSIATTHTVVISALSVLGFDFILTALMF